MKAKSISNQERPSLHVVDLQPHVAGLVDLLTLEPLEADLFRGKRTFEKWTRVFGGQVIAQALMAASKTVDPDRFAHSLHAYFMRPGDPAMPIVYQVDRDHTGLSFSTRRVVAIQNGKPILNLAASFQTIEEGLNHQFPMGSVPPPEDLSPDRERWTALLGTLSAEMETFLGRNQALEIRSVELRDPQSREKQPAFQSFWFRIAAPLPDDHILHRAILAYISDMMLLGASMLPHGVHWLQGKVRHASLDHALWIHRHFRADEWLLYYQESPWTGFTRGFTRGSIYTREGILVASVAQEGLIRFVG